MNDRHFSDSKMRASEHLPSVLLTLLSIIQAVAIGSLWSQAIAHTFILEGSFPTILLGWLQTLVTFVVIVMVWMSFVALLMRFIWVPALADTSLPFVVGVAQFACIEFVAPDLFGYWIISLGLLMVLTTTISQHFFRKARKDPRNAKFFNTVSPATWRNFLPQFIYLTTGLVGGITFVNLELSVFLELACVVIIAAMIGQFLFIQNQYWRRSMEAEPVAKIVVKPDAEE